MQHVTRTAMRRDAMRAAFDPLVLLGDRAEPAVKPSGLRTGGGSDSGAPAWPSPAPACTEHCTEHWWGGGRFARREAASACSWAAGGPASPAGPRPCGSWIVAAGEGPALAEHAERSGAERILQCSGLCGRLWEAVFVEFQELCSDHLTSSQAKTRQCCGRGAPGPRPPAAPSLAVHIETLAGWDQIARRAGALVKLSC